MPGPDHRNSDVEVLRAVSSHPDPVVTVSEMVPYLDYKSKSGVTNRMNALADAGLLNKKEVGARAVIYWLSDVGAEELPSSDSASQ